MNEQMVALQEGRQRYWDRVRRGEAMSPHQVRRAQKALRAQQERALGEEMEEEGKIMRVMCAELTGNTLLTAEEIVKDSQKVPWLCGIYFLVEGNEVVYVGQSVNVLVRIASHRADKTFSKFAYIPCRPEILDQLESLYIHTLRPILNGNHVLTGTKLAPLSLKELLFHGGKYAVKKPQDPDESREGTP